MLMNQKKAGKKLLRGQESNLTPAAAAAGSISRLSVLRLLCSARLLKSRELSPRESVLLKVLMFLLFLHGSAYPRGGGQKVVQSPS